MKEQPGLAEAQEDYSPLVCLQQKGQVILLCNLGLAEQNLQFNVLGSDVRAGNPPNRQPATVSKEEMDGRGQTSRRTSMRAAPNCGFPAVWVNCFVPEGRVYSRRLVFVSVRTIKRHHHLEV
jgi:hypothetical protein